MQKSNQISTNPFPYSSDHHRYHTWNYHLHRHFGEKVFKVSLNAGFTCPNIDGNVAYGGCTFCSVKGSGDFAGNPADHLINQFYSIQAMMHQKWPDVTKYIGYFQAFTNTYAPVSVLKTKFEPILALPGVVGLAVATRADALPDDVISYLAELNERTYLWVELGLQTMHDQTAKKINRGHDLATFTTGFKKLQQHHIRTCIHIINGLPDETPEMMLQTAKYVASLKAAGIKIHLLHVLQQTKMADLLTHGKLSIMDKTTYVELVADQLEILPSRCVIQRVTGDGAPEQLIAPLWSLKKFDVINSIDKTLLARNSYQGAKYIAETQ